MKIKKLITLLLFFLVIPLVHAGECGITNLAACIPEKIYEYLLDVINAPLQPLLELVKTLLQEPVNVDLFIGLWAIIIYVVLLFKNSSINL